MNVLSLDNILGYTSRQQTLCEVIAQVSPACGSKFRKFYNLHKRGHLQEARSVFLDFSWNQFIDVWVRYELEDHVEFYWFIMRNSSGNPSSRILPDDPLFQKGTLRNEYADKEKMLRAVDFLKSCGEKPGSIENVLNAILYIARYQWLRSYKYVLEQGQVPPELIGFDKKPRACQYGRALYIWRSFVFFGARGRRLKPLQRCSCEHVH